VIDDIGRIIRSNSEKVCAAHKSTSEKHKYTYFYMQNIEKEAKEHGVDGIYKTLKKYPEIIVKDSVDLYCSGKRELPQGDKPTPKK